MQHGRDLTDKAVNCGFLRENIIWGGLTETGGKEKAEDIYDNATNKGLGGVFTWRLNSDNCEYEQQQQTKLYDLVHAW